MKRDYNNLDLYYDELLGDIYPQPMDDGHLKAMKDIIIKWITPLGVSTVLDVGCGEGDSQKFFKSLSCTYIGMAHGQDVYLGFEKGNFIFDLDFNFIPFDDNTQELIFSRHSLEHSPFPLITLMEWHRISSKWLCLILPNPEHYKYVGRNHYSVMNAAHAAWILRRAGWKMRKVSVKKEEMWYLCEKAQRIGYEGWAEAPLNNHIYEFERDLIKLNGEIDVKQYFEIRNWDGLF